MLDVSIRNIFEKIGIKEIIIIFILLVCVTQHRTSHNPYGL